MGGGRASLEACSRGRGRVCGLRLAACGEDASGFTLYRARHFGKLEAASRAWHPSHSSVYNPWFDRDARSPLFEESELWPSAGPFPR